MRPNKDITYIYLPQCRTKIKTQSFYAFYEDCDKYLFSAGKTERHKELNKITETTNDKFSQCNLLCYEQGMRPRNKNGLTNRFYL